MGRVGHEAVSTVGDPSQLQTVGKVRSDVHLRAIACEAGQNRPGTYLSD